MKTEESAEESGKVLGAASTEGAPSLIETVARASSAAARELDLSRLIRVIVDETRRFGATMAILSSADLGRKELTLLGERGAPPDLVERLDCVPFDAPLISARAASTRELQVMDAPAALAPLSHEALDRIEATNLLAVPLAVGARLVGVLTVGRQVALRWTAEEVAAIRALAEVFAVSIEAARTHDHERSQLESLRLASLAISAPMALPMVFQNIVDQARTVVNASFAALGVIDARNPEGAFNPWVFSGMSESEAARIGRFPRPVGLLGAVCREARAIRVKNIAEDPRFAGFPPSHPQMTSFLGVPIVYRGAVLGHIYLANKRGADEFTVGDEFVLEMLAQHASIAVGHAREHEFLVREIADRKRDQEALRQSEERFRQLADGAPDVVVRSRPLPSLACEYVNPAVFDMLGHHPADYYRDPGLVWEQIYPLDRPMLEAVVRAPGGGPVTVRWIHANGRIVWGELRAAAVHDEAGNVVAIQCIMRDVTERNRAIAEIERLMEDKESQRLRLQAVIDSSPLAIVLVEDPGGKRVTANRQAENLFGHPCRPDGGMGQITEQCRDAQGALLVNGEVLVTRALAGETTTAQERICLRPDGREVPILVSAAPLRDVHAGITGAVVIYEDISVLKELERLREEWMSIIAHDLRQPVTVIALQADSLAKTLGDEPNKVKVERIRTAANHLARMVDDLLDVSCVDARQLALHLEAVDVVALVRDVGQRMADVLAGHPIRVVAEGEVPAIQADVLRLGQILFNLISNAGKYSYPGSAIDVTVEPADKEVVVLVTNQGEGLSPQEMPKLFARFSRAEQAKRLGVRGVGLGLYITKGLVEAHGGRIWAKSVPGETTTFGFALPTRRADAAVESGGDKTKAA